MSKPTGKSDGNLSAPSAQSKKKFSICADGCKTEGKWNKGVLSADSTPLPVFPVGWVEPAMQ